MIEDDASICDMTKMNLNMNGFQHVYCASDGEEGLALLEHFADAEAVFVLPDGSLRYSPGFPQPGRAAG